MSTDKGPLFTTQDSSTLLLKKFLWRASTDPNVNFYSEKSFTPTIFPEQIVSDPLPSAPPDDFVTLTNEQIKEDFGITDDEIAAYQTTLNGNNVFSIERSQTYTYLYRINKCRLAPIESNPDLAFSGVSNTTNVNIFENTIPFSFNPNGAWRGDYYRTQPSGELSLNGNDIIKNYQLPFVFDSDSGFFTCYQADSVQPNPITRETAPAVSCFVYKGNFGRFVNNSWITRTDNIYYNGGQVVIGKAASSDPSLTLDVSGVSFFDHIVTRSLDTFSDRRLKENINGYLSPSKLLSLTPCTYNYIAKPGEREIGLIAQEVEAVVPEIVKEHNGFKAVQYDRLGALLLPIVREQSERIERLEKSNDELRLMFSTFISKMI
jgi:hypothetical protein